jgi:hypothetical protein
MATQRPCNRKQLLDTPRLVDALESDRFSLDVEQLGNPLGDGRRRRLAQHTEPRTAIEQALAEQSRAALAKLGESEGSPADILTATGRHLLSIVLSPQSIAFHRILFAEAARLPELCARIYQDCSGPDSRDSTRRLFRRLADGGVFRKEDVTFLDQQFAQAIIGRPLRNALLGAPPMSARAQEEHVRKAVALFLHGTAVSSPHSK